MLALCTRGDKVVKETLVSSEFDFDAVFDADDYMYFYGESLTDERSQAEIQALVNLINLDKSVKILDLACGFGRHSNRLAALGHDVTGIDLYSDFLEIAREGAKVQNLNVNYVQGDMRKIRYQAEFDRVLLLFTAFGYFDDETNLLVLENIFHALKPGGMLIFDLPNRDTYLKYFSPCYITEVGDDLMIDRISFDPLSGRSKNRRLVIRDGKTKEKPFTIQLYNANEITNQLLKVDFINIQFFSTWNGLPVDAESRRLIVVAEK
jgi:SAM-dependent methyltransferase